jgi:hypothetical protein
MASCRMETFSDFVPPSWHQGLPMLQLFSSAGHIRVRRTSGEEQPDTSVAPAAAQPMLKHVDNNPPALTAPT